MTLRERLTVLDDIQWEVNQWATHNFGEQESWCPLLGAVEEIGELSHAHLKNAQGIRGDDASHVFDKIDAIGDILIYLMNYCAVENLSMAECLCLVWARVRERDWRKYPDTGLPPAE